MLHKRGVMYINDYGINSMVFVFLGSISRFDPLNNMDWNCDIQIMPMDMLHLILVHKCVIFSKIYDIQHWILK